jgi:peptidoglycan/LPS O-acetylase OafA/YrhL
MSIPPTSEHKQTYTGIQALRFVAAMLVVLAHSTAMVNERMHLDMFKWRAGWSGVDIFFVISGFVMTISSGGLTQRVDGWKIFITRRLIRIVPLYWVATTIKLATILVLPSLALAACIVISPIACLAIYNWFELPMTTRLKRLASFRQ